MSNPDPARARSSQSRYRSEASSRRYLGDAGRAACKAQAVTRAILVVEADPSVREMLALLFTSEGYRTAAVADGKQAVALARGTIKPDIVVADYSLPNGMTGLQVIARVREALGRELPAVILTGDISTDTMREITRRGCVQRYKPVRAGGVDALDTIPSR